MYQQPKCLGGSLNKQNLQASADPRPLPSCLLTAHPAGHAAEGAGKERKNEAAALPVYKAACVHALLLYQQGSTVQGSQAYCHSCCRRPGKGYALLLPSTAFACACMSLPSTGAKQVLAPSTCSTAAVNKVLATHASAHMCSDLSHGRQLKQCSPTAVLRSGLES